MRGNMWKKIRENTVYSALSYVLCGIICALFVSVLLLPIVKKSFFLLFKICYFWFYAWTLIVGAIQLLIPTAKEHSIYYGAAIYYGTILFASFFNYLTNEAVGRDIVYSIGGVITSLLCAVHHYKNKDI